MGSQYLSRLFFSQNSIKYSYIFDFAVPDRFGLDKKPDMIWNKKFKAILKIRLICNTWVLKSVKTGKIT